MRRLLTGVVAAILLLSAPAAALADAAGTAKGVNPAADAKTVDGQRTLVVGADIFIGDTIETGPKGQVQILFADNTRLVVGPHSSLEIEDYLIRNDGSAGSLAVNMLGGSFRFATGNAAKNRYRIDTPTGTIGVRGTRFDTYVDWITGLTRILMYDGITHYCSKSGVCVDLSGLCALGEFDSQEARVYGDTHLIKGKPRDELKKQFIYSDNQSPLLRDFWMTGAYDCTHNPTGVVAPDEHHKPVPPRVIIFKPFR